MTLDMRMQPPQRVDPGGIRRGRMRGRRDAGVAREGRGSRGAFAHLAVARVGAGRLLGGGVGQATAVGACVGASGR